MEGTSERRGWRGWGTKAGLRRRRAAGRRRPDRVADRQRRRHRRRQTGGYGAAVPNGAYGGPGHSGSVDESRSQRPDGHLLSGDTATKVRAAALARYPGAAVLMASDHPSSLAGPG